MIHFIGILSFMMDGALPIILHIILSSLIHIGESDLAGVFTMDTVGIMRDIIKPEMVTALL